MCYPITGGIVIRKMVGYRIKELRINKINMSQEDFAAKLGWDRTYLSRIESGKQNITLDSLEILCQMLDVSLKEFFMYMDEEHMDVEV